MPDATPLSHAIELRLTDQPDVKNRYGSGHLRPTEVDFRYRDDSIRANLHGRWIRDDGTLTDATLSQNYAAYKGDTADWPDWLAELARKHAPAAWSPSDRASVLREAIDAAREEGHRLEEAAGIEAARGARSVAYLLRKMLAKAQPATPAAEAPRVVAYRSPGTRKVYCVICARQETGWQPVTDASDETACDFCGGRVLAVASRTLAGVVVHYLSDEES